MGEGEREGIIKERKNRKKYCQNFQLTHPKFGGCEICIFLFLLLKNNFVGLQQLFWYGISEGMLGR